MPSQTIVQTTVAGTYLNTTSYYSYEALRAYENTYAHGGNAGYLWSGSIPVATIKAYDTFAQVLNGYTRLNSYSRYVFSTFLEDWSGNSSVDYSLRQEPVKIQFSVLLFANQSASVEDWYSLKYNSAGTGTAPLAFSAGSSFVSDTPSNFISAYANGNSNGTLALLIGWLNGKAANPIYEIADASGTSLMTVAQATTLSAALPNISVKAGTTAIVKDSAANLVSFLNAAASDEILGAGVKIALTDGAGPVSAAQAAVLLGDRDSFASGQLLAVNDTPQAIITNLSSLKAGISKISSISVNGEVPLSYTQYTESSDVFAKFAGTYSFKVQGVAVGNVGAHNTHASISSIEVVDTAATVQSNLANLRNAQGKISAITLTDAGSAHLSLSVTQINDNATVLESLTDNGVINVSGSGAQVAASIAQLGRLTDQIQTVTLTDVATPIALSAEQLGSNATVINKIAGSFSLALTDQAGDVSSNLAVLSANVSKISSLTITDIDSAPLVVAYANRDAFSALTGKINWSSGDGWQNRIVRVEGVTLAQAQAMVDLSVTGRYQVKVSIVDTAANLENGAAQLASLSVTQNAIAHVEVLGEAATFDYNTYQAIQNFSGAALKLTNVSATAAQAAIADTGVQEISVLDSAANISAVLPSLIGQESKVRSIALSNTSETIEITVPSNTSAYTTLSDVRGLTAKFAQSYGLILSGVSVYEYAQILRDNADVVSVGIQGRADTVSAMLAQFDASGIRVSSIAVTDASSIVVINASQLQSYSDTLDKLTGTFTYRFSDSYTTLNASLPALEALGARLGVIAPYGNDYINISRSDFEQYASTLTKINNGTRFFVQGYTALEAITHVSDALVGGMHVVDTAANLSARIETLQDIASLRSTFYPISIAQSDAGVPLTLTAAQAAQSNLVLSRFSPSVSIQIQDTSANISARLESLDDQVDRMIAIVVSDGAVAPIALTLSQYASSTAQLSKLTGTYTLKLTEASVSQALSLANDNRFAEFQVWDNVTNIATNLDRLTAMGNKLGAVRYTHTYLAPLEIEAEKLDLYASVLTKFVDGYVLNVVKAPASSVSSLFTRAGVNTITVEDTASNIAANLDTLSARSGRISYVRVMGSEPLSLSTSLADEYAGFLTSRITPYLSESTVFNITDTTVNRLSSLRNNYRTAKFHVVDSSSNISQNFYELLGLGDSLSQVSLTGNASSLTLTASGAVQFSALMSKLASDVRVHVSDFAFNVQQVIPGLITLGDRLGAINITSGTPAISLNIDQITSAARVLSMLEVPYALSINGVAAQLSNGFEQVYQYRDKLSSVFVDYQDNADFVWNVEQVRRYSELLPKVINLSGINIVDRASLLNSMDLSALGSRKLVLTPTVLDADITLNTNGSLHSLDLSRLVDATYESSAINNGSGSVVNVTQNGVMRTFTLLGEGFSELQVVGSNGQSTDDVNTATFAIPIENIDAIGISPDGRYLIIKVSGSSRMINIDSMIEFSNASISGDQISSQIAQTPVFASVVNGTTQYVLPDLFTGPASLGLKYQLIDTTINAVVTGSDDNDFIKVADANSLGKAVNGGGGNDVIDGGVGSTFITGGGGSNIFFLDGRSSGVSWSTITDFRLGQDQVTIWGWRKGVSKVALVDNFGGAPGYDGLTLHFENLLPSDAGEGATNARWNSITLSDRSLSDLGANSVEELNSQILAGNNPFLMTNQTVDDFGTHGYLHIA